MTHHLGWGHVRVAVVEDLDVGPAGRAVADPDLDLVRARGRLVHVLQADVTRSVETRDLHAWLPLDCPASVMFNSRSVASQAEAPTPFPALARRPRRNAARRDQR